MTLNHADNGKINMTIEMPSRKIPQSVVLRLRHPKSTPMKSVTVNSKEWKNFNPDKETRTLQ